MSPKFSQTERDFIELVNKTEKFRFNNKIYTILNACKPSTSRGECKTDVFIKTKEADFKISIKQSNADFLENKTNYERAEQIFGSDVDNILRSSIHSIESSFTEHPLICFEKFLRTEEKTIMLGWKFELLNKKSGNKSGLLQLTAEQKLNVYSGHLLGKDKRDAFVDGVIVPNSGVAEYILEIDNVNEGNLQFYIDKLEHVKDFSNKKNIYFACKALNYRALKDKWDGDRPLAVYVDWWLDGREMKGEVKYGEPLKVKGNSVGNKVREILSTLGIDKDNFDSLREYYKGNSYPEL